MRFLTPAEQRLLHQLEPSESNTVRAFFYELDARMIDHAPAEPPAASPSLFDEPEET